MNRRQILLSLLAAGLPGMPARASTLPKIDAFRDPGCGCCAKWVDHLRDAGFEVTITDDPDRSARRAELGIGDDLASCHTALVGPYAVEGHVPARDILRLLAEKPEGAVGLAVPGMPTGSPGMEYENRVDPYDVMLIFTDGRTEVFASYPA
jgi:hypothetical protein